MYAYLFTHNRILSHTEITEFLNETDAIEHWAKCLPTTYILVSSESASELASRVRDAFDDELRFIIIDADSDRSGWLGRGAWDIMRNPESYSRENRIATLGKRLLEADKRRRNK